MIRLKIFRNIIIAFLLLFSVFMIAGFVYANFIDSNSIVTNNNHKKTSTTSPSAGSVITSTTSGKNANEGAYIESLDSPVVVGSNTSIIVDTNSYSTCSITISYNGKIATSQGLNTEVANSYGIVSWSWNVPNTTPIGNWPIKVTCTYNKKVAVVDGNLEVIPAGNI